jgi:hypothetical protein
MKNIIRTSAVLVTVILLTTTLTSMKANEKKTAGAYLEICLGIKSENREIAAGVYLKYKSPFLKGIKGALSKELLIRGDDVQVLHGFSNLEDANAYLSSELLGEDVVRELKPYLVANPEVRVYSVFKK